MISKFFLKCMIIANSSKYDFYMKKEFYRMKDLLLMKHGTFNGVDVQKIKITCRSCDGTGTWGYWRYSGSDICWDCGGTGIYDTRTYYLHRYLLNGYLFHIPTFQTPTFGTKVHPYPIEGKIKHKDYGKEAGEIAFMFIALRFFAKETLRNIYRIKKHNFIINLKTFAEKYLLPPYSYTYFKGEYFNYVEIDFLFGKNVNGPKGRLIYEREEMSRYCLETEKRIAAYFNETVFKLILRKGFEPKDLPF